MNDSIFIMFLTTVLEVQLVPEVINATRGGGGEDVMRHYMLTAKNRTTLVY